MVKGPMSQEQKNKLRVAAYLKRYGPNWEKILRDKKKAEAKRLNDASEKLAEIDSPTPRVYLGLPLNRTELCLMIVARLRTKKISHRDFMELAKLYAALRKWIRPIGGNAYGNKNPQSSSATKPKVGNTPVEKDLLDMVREIEEQGVDEH